MNEYELKKSLDEIKAKEFQWYEFKELDILALGSSKGSSIDFVKGTKFGIKNSEDGKKYLVTQDNVDKLFTLPDSALDLILSKSKKSTYEKNPETETLQFFEYHEITNAQKKAFVKFLSDYSALDEKQENIMRNDQEGGRRTRYRSAADEAKDLKIEKELEKLDQKKDAVNEKFKEKFSDYIPPYKLKDFYLGSLLNGEFDVEDTHYYLKEFLKKPIVEETSKVKPK